jgi:hypothetical protein
VSRERRANLLNLDSAQPVVLALVSHAKLTPECLNGFETHSEPASYFDSRQIGLESFKDAPL